MDAELIKLILEAGIAVVAVSIIAYLFLKVVKQLLADAKEDRDLNRQSNKENAEAVADAINSLAHNINRLQDHALRQTESNNRKSPE